MCGISVYLQKEPVTRSRAKELLGIALETNDERGPDNFDHRLLENNRLLMTHNRLSLVDLTSAGNQPMEKHSRTVIFNGEIYNFRALRNELEALGHRFETHTDTEVILSAYEEWGKSCLDRFNGAFAFALYDPNDHSLFIARDRVGEKPLYSYRHADGTFMFASSLRQIMYSFKRTWEIDTTRVVGDLIFNFWSDKRHSHVKDIYTVEPGTCLSLSLNSMTSTVERYWEIPEHNGSLMTETNTIKSIREILCDSILTRKSMDAPYGVLLSGGLDSTLLTELVRDAESTTKRKVYTLHREGHIDKDSRHASMYVEGRKDLEHIFVDITDEDMSVDSMVRTTRYMEEPLLDFVYMYITRNYEEARKSGLKAVLNGQGADELFLGYLDYYPFLRDIVHYRDREAFAALWYKNSLPITSLMKKVDAKATIKETLDHNFIHDSADPLNGVLRFGMKTHLPALLAQEDKQSMRWSVECRTCYTDYRLVELAAQIPSTLKMLDNKEKYPLRKIAKSRIPSHVLKREKLGFPSLPDPKEQIIKECLDGGILTSSAFIESTFSPEIHERVKTMPFGIQWKLIAIALFDTHFVQAINEDVRQRSRSK